MALLQAQLSGCHMDTLSVSATKTVREEMIMIWKNKFHNDKNMKQKQRYEIITEEHLE